MPCSDISEITQGYGLGPERAICAYGLSAFPFKFDSESETM
jgi:hypothetical protein